MQSINLGFAKITMYVLGKRGINAVGFWADDVGLSKTLLNVRALDKWQIDRDRYWSAFLEWASNGGWPQTFIETELEKSLVTRITNRILESNEDFPSQS